MSDRTCMIGDDGSPRRLTQKVATAMRERGGLMPEYASQRRKIIVVRLEALGRHPPLLQNAVGRYWTFDAAGSIRDGLWQERGDHVDLLPGTAGLPPDGAIDARRKFMLRKTGSKHYWTPTDDDMEPIIRDIWGVSLSEWTCRALRAPPSEA